MSGKIKGILVEAGKFPKVITVENSIEGLQEVVGGWFECIYPFRTYNIVGYINETGKLDRKYPNRVLMDARGEIYDFVAGPMVLIGEDFKTGDSVSLSEDEKQTVLERFNSPELICVSQNEITRFLAEKEFNPQNFYK